MNIAGPLATLIFAITVLTVFGGLFAYGVYRARERARGEAAAPTRLEFFVEHVPPAEETEQDSLPSGVPGLRRSKLPAVPRIAASLFAIGTLSFGAVHYYDSARRLVMQGAWSATDGSESARFPGPPARALAARGVEPVLARTTLAPSLFPDPALDANGDGVIQAEERTMLHARVPLTLLVTVDDNGDAQGLSWLDEELRRYGLAGNVTFFLTANYLEGRSSHLGGPVSAWWTALSAESFVGIHGLSHDNGVEWSKSRWSADQGATLSAIAGAVRPPSDWSWDGYPWGSRAPYLAFDDAYFASLESVRPAVRYDASMVVHPTTLPPPTDGALPPRDQSWPFSLDVPLPADAELPFVASRERRAQIGSHAIFEVPVYSWAAPAGEAVTWVPSLDVNLYEAYPCGGAGPNEIVVAAFEKNLDAHYRGNRAPFHLGLHAQNYTADKRCERSTLEAMLARVERRRQAGDALRFESIPRLLERLIAAR